MNTVLLRTPEQQERLARARDVLDRARLHRQQVYASTDANYADRLAADELLDRCEKRVAEMEGRAA